MEATKQQIASIFNGYRILKVPFFQRNYVWQKEQWKRFLEDMEFISHCQSDYFLGSVILKQIHTNIGASNDQRTIIDGQQRFTTLVLFIKSLCLKTNDLEIFNQYFMVRDKNKGTKHNALLHSINDRKAFEEVTSLKKDIRIEGTNSNIIDCYNYFQENININKLNIDILLTHIVFIVIELHEQDDEQAIFDTINSLGMRLTTAELLKNFFFNENTKDEYERLWKPTFEGNSEILKFWDLQITAGRMKRSNIDVFFSAFLNIKIHDASIGVDAEHKAIYSRADALFNSYKDLIKTYQLDKTLFIEEIVQFAKVYKANFNPQIAETEIDGEPSIGRINFLITVLDSSTMIPYILYLLYYIKNESELTQMFDYLESYIVRRQICKSNNNSFSDLFSENLIGNKILTIDSLKDYIENKDNQNALSLPNDQYLYESLLSVEYPNKKALAILYLMESRIRSGQPHATKLYPFNEYSLEHLMPKKYEKNWALNEGFDENTRKHLISTLGNMGMLPQRLNSSISNAPWEIKKKGNKNQNGLDFYASDIVTLTDAIKKTKWDESSIIERTDWLAKEAIKLWPSFLPEQDDICNLKEYSIDKTNKIIDSNKKRVLDRTKYSLENSPFMSKAEFVPYFVRQFLLDHPKVTFQQLKNLFSNDLCAKGFEFKGFLCTKEDYDRWENNLKEKRYQPNKPLRQLESSDGIIFYVNTQWTKEAIKDIIRLAENEGYTISTNKGK